VKIGFSRHARRRARLYRIPESTVIDILMGEDLNQGENEIIRQVAGFNYPLKIVISVEEDEATVITTYPLKRGLRK
jgi:hypothetical protein